MQLSPVTYFYVDCKKPFEEPRKFEEFKEMKLNPTQRKFLEYTSFYKTLQKNEYIGYELLDLYNNYFNTDVNLCSLGHMKGTRTYFDHFYQSEKGKMLVFYRKKDSK